MVGQGTLQRSLVRGCHGIPQGLHEPPQSVYTSSPLWDPSEQVAAQERHGIQQQVVKVRALESVVVQVCGAVDL